MASATPVSDPLPVPLARPGCWPDREQELLLRAAVLPPARALPAWREWTRHFDIAEDRIDVGSYRLLPKVYRNLRGQLQDDPQRARLEGLYKRNWYASQLAFEACAKALQALQAAGIEPVLLKGCPLALRYYADIGARPMNDIDLLVSPQEALAAARILGEQGWHPDKGAALSPSTLAHAHAHGFRRERVATELDLHWHVLHFCQDEGVSRRFAQAAVPLQLNRVATRTLCSADHLLSVCIHGLMWNEVPPMRWIVDAMRLLDTPAHPVDWPRLLEMARACRGSLSVHAALSYLRERFDAPVPEAVLAELARTPTSRLEREIYAALTRGGNWRNARLLWLEFQARRAAGSGHAFSLPDFLEHLRVANDHGSRWQTLRWAGSRTLARLARQAWPRRGGSRRA
jgi:hypothetical protein